MPLPKRDLPDFDAPPVVETLLGVQFSSTKQFPTRLYTEYWKRIALAITPLLFGVLGVGLGVVRMRSVKSNAVFVAFGVTAVYWGLHIFGASMAEKGALSPFLAMQLSNIVVIPVAVLSFKRSAW